MRDWSARNKICDGLGQAKLYNGSNRNKDIQGRYNPVCFESNSRNDIRYGDCCRNCADERIGRPGKQCTNKVRAVQHYLLRQAVART